MSLFNRVNLETPESIELEFTLAGIGNRVYALIIDYILLGILLFLSIVIASFLTYQISNYNLFGGNKSDLIQWIWAVELLVFFTIYVGYFVFFETIWQGQTPGKKRASIRVIADNGRTVDVTKALLRSLLRPIDDIFFIGVFLIILSKKEKRIGDLVAGTLVIQEDKFHKKSDFKSSPEAELLAIRIAKQAEISLLSPENFAIIRSYLQRKDAMNQKTQKGVARRLALQVQKIIKLSEIPENTTANLFLEAVYLAYKNHI